MTMMISKFHQLIQSRLLWGAFLIVIVFSFVIWGMVWPSDVDEAERQNAAAGWMANWFRTENFVPPI